jgi:hypothetical protein
MKWSLTLTILYWRQWIRQWIALLFYYFYLSRFNVHILSKIYSSIHFNIECLTLHQIYISPYLWFNVPSINFIHNLIPNVPFFLTNYLQLLIMIYIWIFIAAAVDYKSYITQLFLRYMYFLNYQHNLTSNLIMFNLHFHNLTWLYYVRIL